MDSIGVQDSDLSRDCGIGMTAGRAAEGSRSPGMAARLPCGLRRCFDDWNSDPFRRGITQNRI